MSFFDAKIIRKDKGKAIFDQKNDLCSLNGNRTRILALRGPRPKPLDDKAGKP